MKKLERTAILYTQEKQITNWQLDAIFVWYDEVHTRAKVEHVKKIF